MAATPLACAAALAVLDAFEEDGLLERGRALGRALQAGLERLRGRFPRIGEVRAAGFMCAIEMVADPATREPDAALAQRIIDAAREGGLLVIKCGVHRNVVRFLAPLVDHRRATGGSARHPGRCAGANRGLTCRRPPDGAGPCCEVRR